MQDLARLLQRFKIQFFRPPMTRHSKPKVSNKLSFGWDIYYSYDHSVEILFILSFRLIYIIHSVEILKSSFIQVSDSDDIQIIGDDLSSAIVWPQAVKPEAVKPAAVKLWRTVLSRRGPFSLTSSQLSSSPVDIH